MVRKSLQWLLLTSVLFGGFSILQLDLLHAAPKSDVQVEAQALKVININKAGSEELQSVRGIGPALAERVIKYRDEHGPFKRLEDIVNVRGIGEAKFQKIKTQLSI